MKRLKYLVVALFFVAAVSFVAETASASIPHNARKGGTRISELKKHGPAVKKAGRTHNLKKGRLKAARRTAIKGKKTVPYIYIARKGDTIIKVAGRFSKRARDLRKFNGLKGNSLKPGQKIFLTGKPPGKRGKTYRVLRGYAWETTPAANFARLAEVKKFTASEDLLAGLSMEERLVLFAKKMLHFPYYFGGNGAMGLDCSAYVQKVFSFVGRNIPRSAREQFTLGEAVDREDLEMGDLVFFSTYASFPSHVGIYLGNDLFIHASSVSRKVTINSLEAPYYVRRYIGAKRIMSDDEIAVN